MGGGRIAGAPRPAPTSLNPNAALGCEQGVPASSVDEGDNVEPISFQLALRDVQLLSLIHI